MHCQNRDESVGTSSSPVWSAHTVLHDESKQRKYPLAGMNSCSKKISAVKTASFRRKKCNRPKHNHSKIATDIFKEWFYSNLDHPFPSDEVKADFADRTGDAP